MKEPPESLKKLMKPGEVFVRDFWVAQGCSWKGRTTKRNGKTVSCGHKHRSREAALKCAKKMRKEKPGNCQDYRPQHIFMTATKLT